MALETWVQTLAAIGSVVTPILLAAIAAFGWRLRNRLERKANLEDQLRPNRTGIYYEILEPFVIMLTSKAAWEADPKNKGVDKDAGAMKTLLSIDYRRKAFQMSLVGSDGVVKAYNDLMQFFYARGDKGEGNVAEADIKEMVKLLGTFLLEIRKSVGNEASKLENWDMLEWWMSDARRLRKG